LLKLCARIAPETQRWFFPRLPSRLRSSALFPFHTWLPDARAGADRRFDHLAGVLRKMGTWVHAIRLPALLWPRRNSALDRTGGGQDRLRRSWR
jgi:hypothetical protein